MRIKSSLPSIRLSTTSIIIACITVSVIFTVRPILSVSTLLPPPWVTTTSLTTPVPTSLSDYMSQNPPSRKVTTIRLGCRELEAGAQTCVYTGLICINTTQQQGFGRPNVIFVNDTEEDNAPAASDRWCQFRHQSSDPRYFSSRHWPILNNTFSPQRSCLDARFRQRTPFFTELNVFENPASVKWVPDISLVDLDYISNAHNNHLLKDIIWLLDTNLWQASVLPDYHKEQQQQMQLFKPTPTHIYLPQGLSDFLAQTSVDVNRLLYAIVLRLDPKLLYPNETLSIPTAHIRKARPLLDAYPHLKDTFLFHREQLSAPHAAVCAPRFTVGAKIGNGAHERVCRHIRRTSHALFGVKEPEMQRLGQVFYPRPPRRVVVLQRHITRSIANLHDLERGLRGAFEKRKVEVVIASTSSLKSAEDQVRFFGNVGVLITPHGSQSMGQIWMPRHSAIMEIMPVGYTDYAFNLLSESCRIWYYELQSMRNPNKTEEYYMENCGNKTPHLLNPCTAIKSADVTVNVPQAVRMVRLALERMGHTIDPWLQFVENG